MKTRLEDPPSFARGLRNGLVLSAILWIALTYLGLWLLSA